MTQATTNPIELALEKINRTVDEIGVQETARLSGVPASTIYEAKRRGFAGPPVETLRKLAAMVEARERPHAST